MPTLYAQPYDITAVGFYFDSAEDYARKSSTLRNEHGQPVEEFELQWIDGDEIDCALANAWGLHQGDVPAFLSAVDNWDEHQKRCFIIAVGDCGYRFNAATDHPDDFDIDIYEMNSLVELAEHFIDEGIYGEIPKPLTYYIDTQAIARDLAADYSEITIAGHHFVYACR
jgi:hypothetical protein